MPFRFRRRIKILPGLHVNLNRGGISISEKVGPFTETIGNKGTRQTVHLAKGLSYTKFNGTRQHPTFSRTPAARANTPAMVANTNNGQAGVPFDPSLIMPGMPQPASTSKGLPFSLPSMPAKGCSILVIVIAVLFVLFMVCGLIIDALPSTKATQTADAERAQAAKTETARPTVTQTITVLPTTTITMTVTETSTITLTPTITQTPTITPTPTKTKYPTWTSIPTKTVAYVAPVQSTASAGFWPSDRNIGQV